MAIPYPNPLWSRLLSLALAVTVSALILINPKPIAGAADSIRVYVLFALFWGVAAGFVHGVGFVPRHPLWQIVFHPFVGWLLLCSGTIFLL